MAAAPIIKAFADLAWPLVLGGVAIAYKPELLGFVPAFLRRRLKLELPGGFKVEMDAAEQQKAGEGTSADAAATIELKEIPGLPRTRAIENLERDLHARLTVVTADKVDVLVRNLAQARLEAAFGLIYGAIFGSQIAGLKSLLIQRKVSLEEASKFYSEFEVLYPDFYAGYGFEGWLGFLKDRGMVSQAEGQVAITPAGDDFIEWLRANRLSSNKPW